MTYKENIRAILECYFTGFKDEIIDSACNRILEQEPVLDKVRAEIEQLRLHKAQFITSDNKVCIDSQEVLNIFDKYKPESEET